MFDPVVIIKYYPVLASLLKPFDASKIFLQQTMNRLNSVVRLATRLESRAPRNRHLRFTPMRFHTLPELGQRKRRSPKESFKKEAKHPEEPKDPEELKEELKEELSQKKNNKPDPPKNQWEFTAGLITAAVMLAMEYFSGDSSNGQEPLTFQTFKTNYLEKGLVQLVRVINKYLVEATLVLGPRKTVSFTIGSVDVFEEQMTQVQDALGIPLSERIPISYAEHTSILNYVFPFLPTVLLLGGIYFVQKRMGANSGGGIFGTGKSKAKLFNQESLVKIKFKDVAGCDEAKEEIMEFVSFLKHPQKYERLGARIPRGAILLGPPGTGKTLLAKATAGEAGVPFLLVSGSEFVEMFVGVGASRVRDLFATARKMAPSIIFIDEIDAIGKSRAGKNLMGSNDEKEATLNQLLVEMDGFAKLEHVVVLAGTNREDVLDKALLRPGRFDRHIVIDLPDIEGRKSIYLVYLRKLALAIDKNNEEEMNTLAGKLAALTPGFSGANIANCCNEGALIAARTNAKAVTLQHFEQAIERVIAGLEKKLRVLLPREKKTVAYHEAGHAVCGWFLRYADPLLKVSIIPRGQGALGYAQYLPGDQYLTSEEQFKHRMVMALGGRILEELHFPSVTSGASDDFKKVTQMAQAMVTQLGMLDKLGQITLEQGEGGLQVHKGYSEQTQKTIDLEVKRIVDEALETCRALLKDKLECVDKVAKRLLEREILTRADMVELLGPRPFEERNEAFKKYVDK